MENKTRVDRNYHILYAILWPIFRILFPVKAIGKERIPEGPVVICPNHTAWNDPFCVVFSFGWQFPMRAIAKIEILRWPIVGAILGWAGVIGVDRGNADIKAVKSVLKHIKEGSKMLIFPEGTRVHEGEESEAKAGAALFATRTNVPLLPVYIQPGKRLFRRTTVVVGEAYMPTYEGRKPTADELKTIADDLMVRVQALKEAL